MNQRKWSKAYSFEWFEAELRKLDGVVDFTVAREGARLSSYWTDITWTVLTEMSELGLVKRLRGHRAKYRLAAVTWEERRVAVQAALAAMRLRQEAGGDFSIAG